MRVHRRCVVLNFGTAVCCLLSVILVGCTKESTQPPPAAAQPAAAPPPAQPAATPVAAPAAALAAAPAAALAAAPIASAQFAADPDLRCDLLEVKRISGGALMVRWRLVNTAGSAQSGLTTAQPKGISYDFSWPDLYYIDPAENKKYNFLTDAAGEKILDVWYGTLNAGQQHANWAKFPAPPPTSKTISISLPKFPPFEDVTVAE